MPFLFNDNVKDQLDIINKQLEYIELSMSATAQWESLQKAKEKMQKGLTLIAV